MPSFPILGALCALALTVSAAATLTLARHATSPPAAPPAPTEPDGHLVLQIEGDARALQVTRITRKPDPCGPARFTSASAIVVRDAAGSELGRVPLDLSLFDLDPAHVGRPLHVDGCVVRDTRVAMLANVPHWPDAASLEIVHEGRVLGVLAGARYEALVRAGAPR